MEILKGDSFVCVKKVVMNDEKYVAYKKGLIYYSAIDGYITDEKLDAIHSWPKGSKVKKYFVKLKK